MGNTIPTHMVVVRDHVAPGRYREDSLFGKPTLKTVFIGGCYKPLDVGP